MDTNPRSDAGRRVVTGALLVLAVAATLPIPARALDRDVLLRFLPPEASEVTGYHVYVTDVASGYAELFDAGFVAPDPDGVARTTVPLDAALSYNVAMTAYNDWGESLPSNEIHVAAETPSCDPALCDDGDPCTSDSCDSAGCFSTPLPDGTLCDDGYVDTVDDQCTQGVCEGVLLACRDDFDCDDGNVCNGLEVCDGGRVCLEGDPLYCGEPSACTVPACDPIAGCTTELLADGTPCDDGLAETRDDACWSGLCQGIADTPAPGSTLMVEAVSPDALAPGRHTITVHGQGFVAGAELEFVNGQGRPPQVRRVTLIDDRTLEVILDVSRKGPKRPRLWDAWVGLPDGAEALLPEALRVEP